MKVIPKILNKIRTQGGFVAFALGGLLVFYSSISVAQYEDYEGPEFFKDCHE